GLVHRDVKPDNLMVKNDGRIKVLDFGIAKKQAAPVDASAPTEAPATKGPITEKGSFIGTPRYAAPEQLRGEDVDGRTDQYGWAVTAYELLSGEPPFHAESPVALLSRILTDAPAKLRDKPPDIPSEVEATILSALEKRPEDRLPSMDDVADAIEPFADAQAPTERRGSARSVSARPPPTTIKRAAKGVARVFFWFAAALGTLLIALIALGIARGTFTVDTGPTASAAPSAANPLPSVAGFACREADVAGEASGSFLPRAIGIGACVRLALETDLPFSHAFARDAGVEVSTHVPVDVEVTLGDPTTVTVRAAGRQATSEGPDPLTAMQAAAVALAPGFPKAPLDESRRAAWGAKTDESARRIERTWRHLLLGDLSDAEAATRALATSDPDSPWSHAILGLVAPRGGAESQRAAKRVLELLSAVPPARAKALEGVAIMLAEPGRLEDAIKLFRQSYRDAPDDADIAGLYGAIVLDTATDEGYGVIERVAQDFPTRAIVPLTNAITATSLRDPARNAKYIARLDQIHPEKACEGYQFDEQLLNGDIAAARAQLRDCDRFYGKANDAFASDFVGAGIELAALDADQALVLAKRQLGDSREYMRSEAARLMIGALLLGGRVGEATAALEAEMKRQRDQENPRLATQRSVTLLRLYVRLGKEPPADLVAFIEASRKSDPAAPAYKQRVDANLA
ncbi:MAG: protein kinase, partial [Myxococcales bacterium]|nr:protein kinase [Myxococcales bacterium]